MRPRPVRSKIYLPVVRFGVVSTDWKFILAATLIGYLGPFVLNVRVLRVPLFLWTGLLSALLSYAFFFWARIGRRPHWLQHYLCALVRSPIERRALPADRDRNPPRSWLLKT